MTPLQTLTFSTPLVNGVVVPTKEKDTLNALRASAVSGIWFKSASLQPRTQNPKPNTYVAPLYSLNSLGLDNHGFAYYSAIAQEWKQIGETRPLICSLIGFSRSDFEQTSLLLDDAPFDGYELNLSCPNTELGVGMYSYNIIETLKILELFRSRTRKVFGVKLSAFPERHQVNQMAQGLLSVGVDFVTLCNTYPLACAIDGESEMMRIAPNGGFCGLSGSAIKPINLAQVALYYQATAGKLPIVALGGVTTGMDVYEYILAGATLVGTSTAYWHEGPSIFTRLQNELCTICEKKGIADIAQKRGMVQIASK